MINQLNKKGMFSLDASFAVIILLIISVIVYNFILAVDSSFKNLNAREKTATLLVFSNEIVRGQCAFKTNKETISNKISIDRCNSYISNLSKSNSSKYGFNYIKISLCENEGCIISFQKNFTPIQNNSDVYCINRFVIIDDTNNYGKMVICIK